MGSNTAIIGGTEDEENKINLNLNKKQKKVIQTKLLNNFHGKYLLNKMVEYLYLPKRTLLKYIAVIEFPNILPITFG